MVAWLRLPALALERQDLVPLQRFRHRHKRWQVELTAETLRRGTDVGRDWLSGALAILAIADPELEKHPSEQACLLDLEGGPERLIVRGPECAGPTAVQPGAGGAIAEVRGHGRVLHAGEHAVGETLRRGIGA